MQKNITRNKLRIRKKISGHQERPRISFYKSIKSLYVQAIDDTKGVTICSSMVKNQSNVKGAVKLAEIFDEKLKENKINSVVFDRNGISYHGVVKEFCEKLRERGIVF